MIYEDQLEALEVDSKKFGTTGGVDLALTTDGLKAEREQGITIDVAYRYFSTAKRKFIIADCPGHEQYTRNMATGASDLRPGDHPRRRPPRPRRDDADQAALVHRVAAGHQARADRGQQDGPRRLLAGAVRRDRPRLPRLRHAARHAGPALRANQRAQRRQPAGARAENMPWYEGSTLMHHLENVHIASDRNLIDFRLPVQYVNRPNLNFRGFCGTIASGVVKKGDEVMALPSRKKTRIKSDRHLRRRARRGVRPAGGDAHHRGRDRHQPRRHVIVRPDNLPNSSDKFEATVVWMTEDALKPGTEYLIKHGTQLTPGKVATLRYKIDVNSLHRSPTPTLGLNEIGRAQLHLSQPIAFDGYRRNRGTGAFIIIDRLSHVTVGAGMILDRKTAPSRPTPGTPRRRRASRRGRAPSRPTSARPATGRSRSRCCSPARRPPARRRSPTPWSGCCSTRAAPPRCSTAKRCAAD